MLDFLDTLHDFSITWKLENTIYMLYDRPNLVFSGRNISGAEIAFPQV